jgi:hypothetical protein
MIAKLEARLARLEAKFKPRALRAVIQTFMERSVDDGSKCVAGSLPADDVRLQQGVKADGEAFILRWWSIWFFEGTPEQQEARLKELRLDPQYQRPWNDGEIPVHFEGGATCDDVFARIHKQMQNERILLRHNESLNAIRSPGDRPASEVK